MLSFPKRLKSKFVFKERGLKRIKKAGLSSVFSLANRAMLVAIGLFSIPLTSHYLGVERFGMWLTLTSFLGWVGIADLGLVNSLTNALATADGKEDQEQARKMVSNTFFLMLGLMFVISSFLLSTYFFIPWPKIFNIQSPQAISESNLAALSGIIIFLLKLLLAIPKRIYDAFQEGFVYEVWSFIGNILSFSTFLVALHLNVGLPLLLGSLFGVSIVGDLLAGFYMFTCKRPWLTPRLYDVDWLNITWLLRNGTLMWLSQISAIIMFQTDLIIVAQLFGAREVACYGVTLKLFSLISTIAYAFLLPLWGAYSEALARGDIPWITKTFKLSVCFNLLWSLPLAIAIAMLSPWLIKLWVSQSLIPDTNLLLAMLISSIITVVAHCIGILIVGLCEVSISAKAGLLQGAANILLSITLGKIFGPAGVAWATAICLILFSLGIMGIQVLRRLRKMQEECWSSNPQSLIS